MLDQLTAIDPVNELWLKRENPVEPQNVRYEVVREHRQPVEVGRRYHACAREVGGGDLCALVERDPLAVVSAHVVEALPGAQPGRKADRRLRMSRGVEVVDSAAEVP